MKWILIVIGITVLLIIAFVAYSIFAVKQAFSFIQKIENDPVYTVLKVKNILRFDFGDDYEIIHFHNQPFHPDQPLSIKLSFDQDTIDKIKVHLDGLQPTVHEELNDKQKVKYISIIDFEGDIFSMFHRIRDILPNGDEQTFFRGSLIIDLKKKELRYDEINFI